MTAYSSLKVGKKEKMDSLDFIKNFKETIKEKKTQTIGLETVCDKVLPLGLYVRTSGNSEKSSNLI